ncbi:hypothetical protein SLS62_004201 [Diatrype stigma]|uniref:Uncharacterized protein n=1 Tax=Diatrype stigma TaxID=117547 RepID=A0AAN9UX37_9PEZI
MGSPNESASWVPPPLSMLEINDCTSGTDWVAALIRSSDNSSMLDIPTQLTTAYLRSMIPQNWTSQPSKKDLVDWSYELLDEQAGSLDPEYVSWRKQLTEFPLKGCGQDISLFFATMYFIVLAATRVGIIKTASNRSSRRKCTARIIESFQESINTFLDAALIFAASMLGAALVRYASMIRSPLENYSAYELIGSVFMSAFSIFPALMLQAVSDGPRTHFIRHFLWFAVISFTIAVDVLYRKRYDELKDSYDSSHASQQQNITIEAARSGWGICEDTQIRKGIEHTLTGGHILLALNLVWWLYYLVLAAIPSRWKTAWNSRSRRWVIRWDWRTSLRIANGSLCFAVACSFIGLFHRYRNSIHTLTSESDKDSDWQFGQVLALATWVPVGVDFLAILFCKPLLSYATPPLRYCTDSVVDGPEKGMSGKISSHYRVVANIETEEKGETFQVEGIQDNSRSNLNV